MNKEQAATEEKNVIDDLETQENQDQDAQGADEAQSNEAECEEIPEEKAEKSAAEDEEVNGKYMRLMADFQNYKRRTEKEKSNIKQF